MKLSPQMREQIWSAYDWRERARQLEDEFTRIVAPFQRSAFLYELGQLHEYMTPDRQQALWPYGRSWTATGSNTPALERARAIYHELGALDMVAELALAEFRQTTEPDFLALAGEALLDARLPQRAAKPLRSALNYRPHDIVVKDALAVAELDFDEADSELRRLEVECVGANDATRSRLHLRIARILWQIMPKEPRCGAALKRAYATDPEDDRVLMLVQLYFERTKQLGNLAELFAREAGLASSIDDQVEMYRRGGMTLAVRLSAPARATQLLVEALTLAHRNAISEVPGHLAMLVLLRDAHHEADDLRMVLAMCDQALSGPRTPDERLSLSLFAGSTAWKYLGDIEAARRYYGTVHSIVPDHPRVTEFAQFGSFVSDQMSGSRSRPRVDRPERVSSYSLPVGVRRIDDDELSFWGYTRDFNASGVFVVTDHTMTVDEWVVLKLRVPGIMEWQLDDHELDALVVRAEPGFGFAAQIVEPDDEFAAAVIRMKGSG